MDLHNVTGTTTTCLCCEKNLNKDYVGDHGDLMVSFRVYSYNSSNINAIN